MTDEVVINVDWTLESIKKTKDNTKHQDGDCFACGKEHMQVKVYEMAILNNKLHWSDGSGGVYEKIKVQYCDDCVDEFLYSIQEQNIATK